ncbi:hypothetical protein [Spirillospora sp. NPDC029432]|uniref:hypothetical protein n=1 Tax=Spirillospora sp. NPDC029432 TaxID=3154599 RepID=UPI00345516D5
MTACLPTLPAASADRRPGMPSPWSLPEDGFVDPIAVEIAAAGERRVALTPAERLLATARLLAAGHHPTEIGRRLHVSCQTARTLAAQVRRLGLLPVPDLWLLAYPPADTPAA